MNIVKKIISVLLACIGIPILIYQGIVYSGPFIFNVYCYFTNSSVYTLTQEQIDNVFLRTTYLASALGELAAIIIIAIIFKIFRKSLYKRCNFKKVKAKKLLIISIIIIGFDFLAMTFIYYMQTLTTSYQGAEKAMQSSWLSPIEFIATLLLVPIFEEILFRGAVFSVLKNNLNIYVAIILQGIVFSVMHSLGGGIVQASYTFVLGLILLFASYYANSMYGDILGHIIFNTFGLVIIPIIATIYFNVWLYMAFGVLLLVIGYAMYKRDTKGEKLIKKRIDN